MASFFIRFIFDSLTGSIDQDITYVYFLNGIIFTLIPILFLIRNYDQNIIEKFAIFSFWGLLLVTVITPISFYSNLAESLSFNTRVSDERLNPIIYGRSCSFLFMTSLLLYNLKKIGNIQLFLVGLLSVIGIIISGSRGALLGFILVIIIISFLNIFRNINIRQFLILIFVFFTSVFLAFYVTTYFLPGLNLLENLLKVGTAQDISSAIRLELYEGAFNQFLLNPIFGNSIVEQKYSFYPHNIFLETLMALGLLGGIFLVNMLLLLIKKIFDITSNSIDTYFRYILVLFMLSFIGHQFSGSIFYSQEFWGLFILCIFYNHSSKIDIINSQEDT